MIIENTDTELGRLAYEIMKELHSFSLKKSAFFIENVKATLRPMIDEYLWNLCSDEHLVGEFSLDFMTRSFHSIYDINHMTVKFSLLLYFVSKTEIQIRVSIHSQDGFFSIWFENNIDQFFEVQLIKNDKEYPIVIRENKKATNYYPNKKQVNPLIVISSESQSVKKFLFEFIRTCLEFYMVI